VVALRPSADITLGGWTNDSGVASLYPSLNEASRNDATYIRSASNPSNDTSEVRLDPSSILSDGTVKIALGKGVNNTIVIDMRVALVQGTTEIAAWNYPNVAYGVVLKTETLTGPQRASITDFTDLRIRMRATIGTGAGDFDSDFSNEFA
jgi:hypothetical protein